MTLNHTFFILLMIGFFIVSFISEEVVDSQLYGSLGIASGALAYRHILVYYKNIKNGK